MSPFQSRPARDPCQPQVQSPKPADAPTSGRLALGWAHVLRQTPAPSFGRGRRTLFRLGVWGEGARLFLPGRGSRPGCPRGARRFQSRTLGVRTSQRRTWGATTLGFRSWRAERPSFLPAVAGRRVALARGVDAPAGVSATAAPDRSPRPPWLRCPRHAARLHRILIAPGPSLPPRSPQTPSLFAPGHPNREPAAGGGFPGAPRPRPSPPAARPPRAREFQAQIAERIPPPPLRLRVGGRGQARAGARGARIAELGPAPPARSGK